MQLSEGLIQQAEQQAEGLSYPGYVKKLKDIGVSNYEVRIKNHNRKFTSQNGEEVLLRGDLPPVECAETFDLEAVKEAVRRRQNGLTDYPTFLTEIAGAGVHNYIAD